MEETNKIKFALYLKVWDFQDGDKNYLRKTAQKIPATEYIPEMKGHLFCPECTAPLFRSPAMDQRGQGHIKSRFQ